MKSCGTCRDRNTCKSICAEVEKRLPGEYAGFDPGREVLVGPDFLEDAAGRVSYSGWEVYERKMRGVPDLSCLTKRERQAILTVCSGLSQRAAAVRLKITRQALRTLYSRAVTKLRVAHFPHLLKTETNSRTGGGI